MALFKFGFSSDNQLIKKNPTLKLTRNVNMKKHENVNFILDGKSSQFPWIEFDGEKQKKVLFYCFTLCIKNDLVFTDYLLINPD